MRTEHGAYTGRANRDKEGTRQCNGPTTGRCGAPQAARGDERRGGGDVVERNALGRQGRGRAQPRRPAAQGWRVVTNPAALTGAKKIPIRLFNKYSPGNYNEIPRLAYRQALSQLQSA